MLLIWGAADTPTAQRNDWKAEGFGKADQTWRAECKQSAHNMRHNHPNPLQFSSSSGAARNLFNFTAVKNVIGTDR